MMLHDEARMLASARADGELNAARAPELEEHLAACPECAAFADGIERLRGVAASLPRQSAPAGFEARVTARLFPASLQRRRWRARIGTLAAAAAVALAIVVAGLPVRTFRIEPAEAARGLLRIETLDVQREIVETTFGGATTRTRERIRYRAPASVRIDRTDPNGRLIETEIRLPGKRYVSRGGDGILEIGRPPEANAVPEPLSPVLALVGTPAGRGPVVAGRPTTRVVISDPGFIRREALVDAERSTVLEHDVNVVLEKNVLGSDLRRITKRTLSIRYNVPIPHGVFEVPVRHTSDAGFRRRPVAALALTPSAAPEGFSLVLSGSGPSGDALLYARGAFTVLVQIGVTQSDAGPANEIPTTVHGRAATVVVGLYDLPVLRFDVRGREIAISAPAPVNGLRRIAEQMFRE